VNLLPESVWLALDPVDMRTGVNGLSLHMQQVLGRAPCDGTAYVFSNRCRTRLKVVS
jgi:transposase